MLKFEEMLHCYFSHLPHYGTIDLPPGDKMAYSATVVSSTPFNSMVFFADWRAGIKYLSTVKRIFSREIVQFAKKRAGEIL